MHPLRPGDPEKLGEYAISGRLADGPRGVAYLGRESDDAPLRVIRLLPAAPEQDDEEIARLRGVQRVSSSYVARTLESGRHADRPYVVREYVEGRSLTQVVTEDGPLDHDALERLAVGMLTALTAVHLAGITHRGLTPHNVIIGAGGPRVTDVDLGGPVGELGYRAPEQLRGPVSGPQADMFAWAATMVFAATGEPPFGQDAESVLNGLPEVGNLTEPLRGVVLAALAKEVEARPTTYAAMLRLLGDQRGGAGPTPQQQPSQPGAPLVGVPIPAVPLEGMTVPGAPIEGVPLPVAPPPQQAWGPTAPPQAQGGASPMEGVPVPPSGPMWEPPRQDRQAMVQGQTVSARPPRKFPLGLAAAVGVLVVLSGAGLWGASEYASTQRFEPVNVAVGSSAEGTAEAVRSEQAAARESVPEQQEAQPEVTVPWGEPSSDADVGPMVLPSDWTSQTPTPPELSTVPTPAPIQTQPVVPQPTQVTPTVTVTPGPSQSPTPTSDAVVTHPATPEPSSTPTPTPTVTVTVTPTPTPTPTVSEEPTSEPTKKPSPTKTPSPTKKPSKPKRTPTKTPKPEPTKTSSPSKQNPYTPVMVCGPGFSVQRSQNFPGGETFQLYNGGSGENCVVTMKTTYVGTPTEVTATLEVKGGRNWTESGNYMYYAGPVKLPARGKCVRFSGSHRGKSTSSNWANCG
ncbi:serine/threonine protein kinase [Nonomuraea diastatica]|uniref:non-specific serine/threonine protein kinase n=1 Tax=Nonomuraea diastatica TaxID=1848329 RepID=A0A4R4X489_9ACTN|nr:serine/threonine protein kinase [Nonomuraea diastatica]TDD25136.1 serine/threonine protein kinase [Nonomuraea diastatica]